MAPRRGPGPRPPARQAATVAGLWLLAVATRLLFLGATTDRGFPFSVFYYGDSRLYREYALALLDGRLYDSGLPFHPPLFAWVLAATIELVGERATLVRALLAGLAATVVPLTYLLGRRLLSPAAAWIGAGLATFSFGLLVLAVSPNVETIYLPLLLVQILLAVDLADALRGAAWRRAAVLAAMGGAALGLGSLARAEHLGYFVLLPLAVLLAAAGRGRPLECRAYALALLPLLVGTLVLLPWTLRNARAVRAYNAARPELERPLPALVVVSSYGPLNFALANHPEAAGGFDPRPLVGEAGQAIDLADPRHLDFYLDGYRRGLESLAADPGGALRLLARKLRLALGAHALGFGLENRPAALAGLAGARAPVDVFVPERRLWLPVSLLLTALGLWQARSAWRRGAIVWLAVLHKVTVCLAFFGYARLFLHLAPLAFLLQGHALVSEVERLAAPRPRRWLAAAAAAVALGLLLELALAVRRPRDFVVDGAADARGKIVQDAPLRIRPAGDEARRR